MDESSILCLRHKTPNPIEIYEMKILQGPLYVSRECDCWSISGADEIDEDDNPTKSWSWEPEEKQDLNMGLHGRSVCWNEHWTVSSVFTGLDLPFIEVDSTWLAEQKATDGKWV